MKDGKFEAADFYVLEFDGIADWCAGRANTLLPQLKAQWLEELLRDAPKVYGKLQDSSGYGIGFSRTRGPADTHTARLVDIKEIVE